MVRYPVMLTKKTKERVEELINFRRKMKVNVTNNKAQEIWGRRTIENLPEEIKEKLTKSRKGEISQIAQNKINIAKQNLDFFKILKLNKYIGISGSIAAGFAKEEDDIDIYIVVKNHTAWIYRGILTIKNIFNHLMRTQRDGDNVKDLFCVNFISEERGLLINNDTFNFHELMYNIPISENGEEYIKHIYKNNPWLIEEYFVKKELLRSKVREESNVNILIILNYLAYLSQVTFMIISGHRPNIKRIRNNYSKGRIEFFPEDFKQKVK